VNNDAVIAAPSRRVTAALVVAGGVWAVAPVHPGLTCPFRAMTGLPCPLCGMTRAVTAGLRGDVVASLRFQPAGLVLIALGVWLLVRRSRVAVRLPPWVLPATFGAMWLWNLTLNPTFH
jgi:hypothetical protein